MVRNYQRAVKHIDAACAGDWSADNQRLAGERNWNLERLFNLKAGLSECSGRYAA